MLLLDARREARFRDGDLVLLRRVGRTADARDGYRHALALVHDDAERRLLERRLAELGTAAGTDR